MPTAHHAEPDAMSYLERAFGRHPMPSPCFTRLSGPAKTDIAQIATVPGFDGAPRRVVRQPKARQRCGHGQRERRKDDLGVCQSPSGGLRPSPCSPPELCLLLVGPAAVGTNRTTSGGLHLTNAEVRLPPLQW